MAVWNLATTSSGPDRREVSSNDDVRPVSSAEVAEAAKLFENTFRAVNIALVNELKLVLDRLDIDRLDIGLSADPELVPDLWDLADLFPVALAELLDGSGLGAPRPVLDPFGEEH